MTEVTLRRPQHAGTSLRLLLSCFELSARDQASQEQSLPLPSFPDALHPAASRAASSLRALNVVPAAAAKRMIEDIGATSRRPRDHCLYLGCVTGPSSSRVAASSDSRASSRLHLFFAACFQPRSAMGVESQAGRFSGRGGPVGIHLSVRVCRSLAAAALTPRSLRGRAMLYSWQKRRI